MAIYCLSGKGFLHFGMKGGPAQNPNTLLAVPFNKGDCLIFEGFGTSDLGFKHGIFFRNVDKLRISVTFRDCMPSRLLDFPGKVKFIPCPLPPM